MNKIENEITTKIWKGKYPNHRTEHRNVRIVQTTPAAGWWRTVVTPRGDSWIEPVAFFITVVWEERGVWDGGHGEWKEEMIVRANSATDGWEYEFLHAMECDRDEVLFYDPDFRLSRNEQSAGDDFVNAMKEYYTNKLKKVEGA